MARRARLHPTVLAALVGAAGAAGAEPLSLVLPKSKAGDDTFVVAGSDARGAATLRGRVGFDFTVNPLVVLGPGAAEYRVVERQVLLEPALSFALADRVLFSADVPVVVAEVGGARPVGAIPIGTADHGPGLGDVGLGARARVIGAADSAVKGSLRADFFLPTATGDFAGSAGLRARPSLGVSVEGKRARGALEGGFLLGKAAELPGLLPVRAGSALTAGLGGAVAVERGRRLWLGGEITLLSMVGGGARLFDPRSSVGQALTTCQLKLTPLPVVLGAAVGPGLGQGPGAADLRALASISYSPEAPPPPPDDDNDAIPDATDACPRVRGVASGDPMMHGCPALPTDTDGDTVSDVRDACPRRSGLPHKDPKLHGCPPAPPPPAPPPAPPPPPRATLAEQAILISEQVQFDTDTAIIRGESDALLADVARVLLEHPELVLVEIQGHTDSTGTPEHNQQLSEERARAVTTWLVLHGIASERLRAVGHGQDVPLADNATEEGRTKNRRVEFRVLERKKEPSP